MTIETKPCRHGRMMYYTNDVYIGQGLDQYGEYSEGESALWKQFVKPGMTALDVGSNIGALTLPLAKLVGLQGKVMAFEPQRQLYQMSIGNLALNEIVNTSVLMCALGDVNGTARVPPVNYTDVGNFGCVALNEPATVGELVPKITIDSLDSEVEKTDFIKIDVEGMECAVLRGAQELIAKSGPILYVENDREDQSPELLGLLSAYGYRVFWHKPMLFNPKNFFKASENIWGNVASFNVLAIHKATEMNVQGLQEII